MTKLYCKCLNVSVVITEPGTDDDWTAVDDIQKLNFFKQLPLIVARSYIVSKQQPSLIKSENVGSWITYKCINCCTPVIATRSDKGNSISYINEALSQISEDEVKNIEASSDYSPIFRILITSLSQTDKTSHRYGESNNNRVSELKKQLFESIERKRKNIKEMIQKFNDEQQSSLKKYISRANNDFQSLKNNILITDYDSNSVDSYKDSRRDNMSVLDYLDETSLDESIVKMASISPKFDNDKNWECDVTIDIPPSLDSEGLFPLDGVEDNTILGENDQSAEEDLSDTDDSGSRDEGIHIPRRMSLAFARSLPIKVPKDFDPSLRLFYGKFEDIKGHENYKNKIDRPIDIAASMRELANSVHGDPIFGDLPRPKISSRI